MTRNRLPDWSWFKSKLVKPVIQGTKARMLAAAGWLRSLCLTDAP